jgi:hypothetical protein
MFSINSSIANNNYTIIILICVVILCLFSVNSNKTSCNIRSIKSIKNSQKDREYIKDVISRQERILLDLQNKIEKKMAEKNTNSSIKTGKTTSRINVISTIKSKDKINTIESLDGSVELSKSNIHKNNKLAKIKSKNNSDNSSHKLINYEYPHQTQPTYPRHPHNPHFNPLSGYPMQPPLHRQTDPMYIRDNQVLNDKLYPPLGRTERPTADLLMNFINNQPDLFNMHTRGPPDTFRPIGYLTRKDGDQTIDSTLILYGRAKYPNSDMGEFYVTSSNKMSDIKVPILQNNSNIRKITDVPNDVEISGNLFNGKYSFTELPKPDFPTPYM